MVGYMQGQDFLLTGENKGKHALLYQGEKAWVVFFTKQNSEALRLVPKEGEERLHEESTQAESTPEEEEEKKFEPIHNKIEESSKQAMLMLANANQDLLEDITLNFRLMKLSLQEIIAQNQSENISQFDNGRNRTSDLPN